jgi:hypothetical protein
MTSGDGRYSTYGRPYKERGNYLIQRGFINEDAFNYKIDNFDQVVKLDYMGAAEYEFGALPESLARMRKAEINFAPIQFGPKGEEKYFFLIFKNDPKSDVITKDVEEVLQALYNAEVNWKKPPKYTVKRGTMFHKYFEGPTKTELKKGCKKKTIERPNYGYMNFWWDIVYDWMIVPTDENFSPKYLDLVLAGISSKKKVEQLNTIGKIFRALANAKEKLFG